MVTHHCCLTVLTVIPCCDFHRFLYIKLHLQKQIVYFVFFVFLIRPIINCPVPFLSKFVVLSVEVGYSFTLFSPHKPTDLWPYFPQFLQIPLREFVLVLFISPEFNAKTLSSFSFYYLLLMTRFLFHNQLTYLLRSL